MSSIDIIRRGIADVPHGNNNFFAPRHTIAFSRASPSPAQARNQRCRGTLGNQTTIGESLRIFLGNGGALPASGSSLPNPRPMLQAAQDSRSALYRRSGTLTHRFGRLIRPRALWGLGKPPSSRPPRGAGSPGTTRPR